MITVPASFRAMPRWAYDASGRAWLDDLPRLTGEQCDRWGLTPDGPPAHGSNALVLPVTRGDQPLALRLAPPGDDVSAHARDLELWGGHGVVRLHEKDLQYRALLLERLDATRSLADVPLREAVTLLAGLTRHLAVPVPQTIRSTAQDAADLAATLEHDWRTTGRPVPEPLLRTAISHAQHVAGRDPGDRAANGDLHFEQVLQGTREPWIVVDPVLLRGDPEYDLGRILWSRLDEVPRDEELIGLFDLFVETAGVPGERARSWVLIRAASYLVWGLQHGLTRDPPKCVRLMEVFA